MLKLVYDDRPDCNLRGIYDTSVHTSIPTPHIPITEIQRVQLVANKLGFRVAEGKLIELRTLVQKPDDRKLQKLRRELADELLGTHISVGERKYLMSEDLQKNVNLNLNISSFRPTHSCKLWCIFEDKWVFKDHDKEALVDLAIAFNSKRESLSESLYMKLR